MTVAACALLYGLHNVFSKAGAAAGVAEAQGALVLESVATVSIAIYLLLFARAAGGWNAPGRAYAWSAAAGLCAGLGTIAYFAIFRRGAELSRAGPMVLLGGVLVMTVAGFLFFREPLTWKKGLGLLLGVAGLYLLRGEG